MSEPITLASKQPSQALQQIESNPLSPESWLELARKAKGQNDPLSIKSLEIIINGLYQLDEMNARSVERKEPPVKISPLSLSMFSRLSKAYNSPTLLKEVGLIYLRDLKLPTAAHQHFERSLRLGGPEKELRPLIEAAAVASQRQMIRLGSYEAGHLGITTAQHAKPVAPEVIRKTGKMLAPSRFAQTTATKLTEKILTRESPVENPLPATTPECLIEAANAVKDRQFKRAEALLRKANDEPGQNAEMWHGWTNLGYAAYEAGQYPLVEAAFVEAVKFDPEEMASHFNLGLGYHLNGKHELALVSYLKANQIEPKHPKVWCNLGVLYFQLDQFPQAELALRYATMANPEYARAWDNLAASLGAQDKMEEAILACKKAIELRPDYPEAYFKLGVIYFTQNLLPKAAEEFRRAALLPALGAYSDAFQAMIHARLEQTEAAEAAVERAVSIDPKCDLLWMAWNEVGLAWYTAGNYAKAATAYGEATMIKPDEPEAWFNLGVSFHQIGDLEAARDAYQQAVDLNRSLAGAWHNLGIVCAQMGDHQVAMSAFLQEVHWAPGNVRAWYDLGVTLSKLGRHDEAVIAYSKADEVTLSAASEGAAEENSVSETDSNGVTTGES